MFVFREHCWSWAKKPVVLASCDKINISNIDFSTNSLLGRVLVMSDSKCKSNVVSQSVALNTTVEQLQRWVKDISNDGLDAISTS